MKRTSLRVAIFFVSTLAASLACAAPPSGGGGGGGAKPATASGLAVVDVSGKTVGKFLLGSNGLPGVLFTVGSAVYGVNLERHVTPSGSLDESKLGYIRYQQLYFASADCTGQGLADRYAPFGVAPAVTLPSSNGLLLYPLSGVISSITYNSVLGSPDYVQAAVCTTRQGEVFGYPVVGNPIDISGQFAEPFSLQ